MNCLSSSGTALIWNMHKIQVCWTSEKGKEFQICLWPYLSIKRHKWTSKRWRKRKKKHKVNQTKNFNSSRQFHHQRTTEHTEKLASTLCCYLTVHLSSHLPVLASRAIRVRKDETGHYRVYHRRDSTRLGGCNSAAWPQGVISEKRIPLAQWHHRHVQHLLECAQICHPLPWCAAKKETDTRMCFFLGTWVLSFLFLLYIPWNQGVTSQTFPEGFRKDLQIHNYIEAC